MVEAERLQGQVGGDVDGDAGEADEAEEHGAERAAEPVPVEAGQMAQVAELLAPVHLAGAEAAVVEGDRDLGRREGAAHHQFQSDLVAGRAQGCEVGQGAAVDGEEAGQRVRAVGQRAGEHGGQARVEEAPQAPGPVEGAAGHVAAADRHGAVAVEGGEQRRDRFGRVRQVGVHDHDAVVSALFEAVQHRKRQVAGRLAAGEQAHRQALRERGGDGRGVVVRVVVGQHQFPGDAGIVQRGLEAFGEAREVGRFAEGRHHDGDRARGGRRFGHGRAALRRAARRRVRAPGRAGWPDGGWRRSPRAPV